MTRLHILVEGDSEEAFVSDTLRPHLAMFGVFVGTPYMLWTKHLPQGGGYRGGVSKWEKIHKDLRNLLGDTNAMVSTMLDCYGLPADFPGKSGLTTADAKEGYSMVEKLQKRFAAEIGSRRFIPFLTLFEFESLVFSSPKVTAAHFGLSEPKRTKLEHAIQSIVDSAKSVELINGGKNTYPKKRLVSLLEEQGILYGEVRHGSAILQKIGIPAIRAACPHFNAWLTRLESLGADPR